jgi:two-component system, OmpR family, response regulator
LSQSVAEGHGRRVLAVDDEPAVTLLIRRVLETAGYEVKTAATGEEALEAIRGFTPDLLIVDKNLPRMTGFELVKAARVYLPHLPVMVITAAPDSSSALTERIDAYLPKPFLSLEAFRAAVAEAFEHNRSARERLDVQRKLNEVVAQLRRS